MKNVMINNIFLVPAMMLFLIACNSNKPDQAAEEPAPSGGLVTFTTEQVAQAGIKFGYFEEKELSHDVNARGKLVLPNNKKAEVNSVLGGIVSEIFVHYGEQVGKGQPLCRLVHPDIIRVQQEYLNSKYNLEVASSQYARQQLLLSEDIASKKNYQLAERDYLIAKTTYDASLINIRQAGFMVESLDNGKIQEFLDVKSPISGKVEKIDIYLGQYIDSDRPLFVLVDKRDLHVELMVFEKDIPYVESGQRVTLTLSNIGDKVFEGHVYTVGSVMEETARTIPVLAHMDEIPENSYPGMFVAATIHTGESIFSALPEDAIIAEREGEYYFYFTTDDPDSAKEIHFKRVGVKPGLIEDGFASMELLDPLPENALIVISGGYYIRSVFIRSLD